MASKFTNRLVGTIALVALGVIFLPDLLDGEKKRRSESFAVIPIKPQLAEPEPQSTEQLDQLLSQDLAQVDLQATVNDQQPAPPQTAARASDDAAKTTRSDRAKDDPLERVEISPPKPLKGFDNSAWVIQLGGFKNASNVNALVRQLREAGFDTYTKPKRPRQGQITRVYVGPNLDRSKLEKQVAKLKKLTGLSGEIYPYNPVDS